MTTKIEIVHYAPCDTTLVTQQHTTNRNASTVLRLATRMLQLDMTAVAMTARQEHTLEPTRHMLFVWPEKIGRQMITWESALVRVHSQS